METFSKLNTLPEIGDTVKFADNGKNVYGGVLSSDEVCITKEPEQAYTVVDVDECMITARGNQTSRVYTMNDSHWKPVRSTTPIPWETRKRVYRHQKRYGNVSDTARKFDISRRSVGRIVADISHKNWFTRMLIRMGL